MNFKGGPEEALKLLQALDEKRQEQVLKTIGQKDPKLFQYLKNNLVRLDDLKFVSTKTLIELLKQIKIDELGIALKMESQELKDFFAKTLPSRLVSDLNQAMHMQNIDISKVEYCRNNILEVLRKAIDSGQLVIKRNDDQIID